MGWIQDQSGKSVKGTCYIYSKASINVKGMYLIYFLMHYYIKYDLMRGLYARCLMNIQYFSHLVDTLFQRLSFFILICCLLRFYSIKTLKK